MLEKSEVKIVPLLPLEKNDLGKYPIPKMRCGLLPYYLTNDNQIMWGLIKTDRILPDTYGPSAGTQDIIAFKNGQRYSFEVSKPFPYLAELNGFHETLFRDEPYQKIITCLIKNGFKVFTENPLDTALHETAEEHGLDLRTATSQHQHLLNSMRQLPIQTLSGKYGADTLCLWATSLKSTEGIVLNHTDKIENKIQSNLGKLFSEEGCWRTLIQFTAALEVARSKYAPNDHRVRGVFETWEYSIQLLQDAELLIKSNLNPSIHSPNAYQFFTQPLVVRSNSNEEKTLSFK